MKQIPVYKFPGSYAQEHGELPEYRASNKANAACKEAIESAIRENYRDNHLSSDAAKQVVEQFGFMFWLSRLGKKIGMGGSPRTISSGRRRCLSIRIPTPGEQTVTVSSL